MSKQLRALAPGRFRRRQWLSLASASSAAVGLGLSSGHAGATPIRASREVEALSQWVTAQGGQLSVNMIRLADGQVLASKNPALCLNPASNMKLVTAAVALDTLGPAFEFQTGLYTQSDGPVLAELCLRGNGAPDLTEHGLWRLANALATRGITRVRTLLVDQSRFDDVFVPPAFEQQPSEWAAFRAPVSAIAVDRNAVTLNVLPTQPGTPARLWFQPAGAVTIAGSVATVKPGTPRPGVQLQLHPAEQGLRAVVGGSIASGMGRQRYRKRVEDPRLLPGFVFRRQLQQLGIPVDSLALGGAHLKRRLTYHASAPLLQVLMKLGKRSDNFTAEMLFKGLAAQNARGATFGDAAALVERWLKANKAWRGQMQLRNGSGLFDANRISADCLTTVLRKMYHSPGLRPEYLSHLSIGGVDGTLSSRFRGRATSRALRAKTGTLKSVISLSGYALETPHGPCAFSFLLAGIAGRHAELRRRTDAAVESLLG